MYFLPDLDSWFARAANTSTRPLPLCVLCGPIGCGKTTQVHQLLAHYNVETQDLPISELSTTGSSDPYSTPLTTRTSMDAWKRAMRARVDRPRILVVDHAEDVLDTHSVSANDYLELAAGNIPVLIVVYDMYATPVTRDLAHMKDKYTYVYMAAPNFDTIVRIVHTTFPDLPLPRVQDAALHCNGDVRRALLDVQYPEIRVTSCKYNVFDTVTALLGVVHGKLPSSTTAQEQLAARHANLTQFLHAHYLEACPTLEDACTAAETYAETANMSDVLHTPGTTSYVEQVAVPAFLRERQTSTNTFPGRMDFSAPIHGKHAEACKQETARIPDVLRMLANGTGKVNKSTATTQYHRILPDIVTMFTVESAEPKSKKRKGEIGTARIRKKLDKGTYPSVTDVQTMVTYLRGAAHDKTAPQPKVEEVKVQHNNITRYFTVK